MTVRFSFLLGRQNSSALDRTGSSSAPEVQLSKWCVELWYPSLGDNVIRRETILGLEQLWCESQMRLRVSLKMGQIDWISVTGKLSLLIYLHYNNFWHTTGFSSTSNPVWQNLLLFLLINLQYNPYNLSKRQPNNSLRTLVRYRGAWVLKHKLF